MNLIINIGENTYTTEILREGYIENYNCGEAGKHATSSISCQIRPTLSDGTSLANLILKTDGYISTVIKDGDATIFSGVIRPFIETSSSVAFEENLELEIMDYTETMHLYVWEASTDGSKEGRIYPDVKKNTNLPDLLEYLFGLCNKSVDKASIPSTAIPYFKLNSGEYLDTVISTLLQEFEIDYKWSALGVAEFFYTFPDDTQSKGTINTAIDELSTTRSDDTSDGLRLNWKTYKIERGKTLLNYNSGNIQFSNFPWTAAATLEGKFWSGKMHDKEFNTDAQMPSGNLWNWNLSQTGIRVNGERALTKDDVLFVETKLDWISIRLLDEEDVSYSGILESYDINGMRFWINYNGRFNVNLDFYDGSKGWTWAFDVIGNIGYATDSSQSYAVTGSNPENLTLKYRMAESEETYISSDFAKKYYTRQKLSKVQYSFSSLSSYEIGAFYSLVDPVAGRTSLVRIISKKKDADGIYSYKAEGAGTVADYPVTIIDESKFYSVIEDTQGEEGKSIGSIKTYYLLSNQTTGITRETEGWQEEPLVMTPSLKYLWQYILYKYTDGTDATITDPVIVGVYGDKGDKGETGSSNALITLYKRSATQPESYDGGALTYTFATDTLSGNLGSWSRSISSGSNPLYAITARAYGTGETDIIDIGEWSAPAILSENGTKGENGSTVAVITLYKRGDSAPATPSKTVSFSFHTYTVTNSDGWTLGIPSGSAPCWSIYATAVSANGVSDTIEPSEWSEPTKAVENGEKGDKGETGDTGDSITIIKQEVQYQISASGTAVPSGAWEDMPKPKKGYYLWTRISVYYSDSPNQPRVTYNVSYIAENPQPLLFAWSSSSAVFTPKDNMRVWMYSSKYVQFDSKLMGDFALYNFAEWDEVIKARSDEYPYLWCKYSEDSDPLPVTGKDGKEGLSVYSSVQYHLDVSASLTTSQLQALPSDSWLEEEQCTWEYGRYIYKRLKKTTVETGAIEYTYQGRDTELENHFKNLLSFKISANRLNYPIDKRALDTEKTTIKILIEETYYNPDSYSVTINGEVQTPTITNDSFTFDIPLKTGKDLYNIVVIPVKDEANITDVFGELNIIALDITEYDKFYGAVSSLTFSGITLLDGDSCFLTQADGDNEANKIYVYQSNAWVDFNSANLSTDKRMLILSKAQKSALEYANLKGTIAAEYGYIGTLIANYVYAREIGAETIALTGDKGKLVGGDYTTEDTDGFLANKGIYLDSTGTAKLNDAKLKNCKINDAIIKDATITDIDVERGTIKDATFNNVQIVGGTFSSDSLDTRNENITGDSYSLVDPVFNCRKYDDIKNYIDSSLQTSETLSSNKAFEVSLDSTFFYAQTISGIAEYQTGDALNVFEANHSAEDSVPNPSGGSSWIDVTYHSITIPLMTDDFLNAKNLWKITAKEIIPIAYYSMGSIVSRPDTIKVTNETTGEELKYNLNGQEISITAQVSLPCTIKFLYSMQSYNALEQGYKSMLTTRSYYTSVNGYNDTNYSVSVQYAYQGSYFFRETDGEPISWTDFFNKLPSFISTSRINFSGIDTLDKYSAYMGLKKSDGTKVLETKSLSATDITRNGINMGTGVISFSENYLNISIDASNGVVYIYDSNHFYKQGSYPSISFIALTAQKGVYASDILPKGTTARLGVAGQEFASADIKSIKSDTVDTTSINATNLNSKPINRYAYVRDDGVMEVGQYIDFHTDGNPNSRTDYHVRLQAKSDGIHVYVNGKADDIGIWGAVAN